MKIVRVRARAVLALAVCGICSLAVMKALTDMAVVDDAHLPADNNERGRDKSGGNVDRRGMFEVKQGPEEAALVPQRGDMPNRVEPPAGDDQKPADVVDVDFGERRRNQNQHLEQQRPLPPRAPSVNEAAAPSNQNSSGYPQLLNGKFVPGRRIVHLDLKGAAPKLFYFEKFFQMIGRLGATGVLIEWEDMFPYSGELAEIRNGKAYSEKDVRTIIGWARENKLEVIPLVQTFGHLEWVLKHKKYADLREVDRFPQVICLSNPKAIDLVKMIVDQVMSIHGPLDNGEFFHMGADEAFQVGMCEKCIKSIREKFNNNREKFMLNHIRLVAEYVKEKHKRRVLMWHDMLTNVDFTTIKEAGIGDLVEPVVWAYAENLNDFLTSDMWQRFSQSFSYIWAASAFKGADGPTRYYSNVPHYMQNHISWAQQMNREFRNFREFRGLMLTGWQRFDHFAVLCELLPVGVPSLAVNLQIAKSGGEYNRQIIGQASQLLECSSTLEVDSPGVAGSCQFPGSRIYQYVQQLKMAHQTLEQTVLDDYQLRGWLSPFNMVHNYSSAWYLDQVADKLQMSVNEYQNLQRALRAELSKVFEQDTVDEFLLVYLEPDLDRLQKLLSNARRLGQLGTFPARPFPIVSMLKQDTPSSLSQTSNDNQPRQL